MRSFASIAYMLRNNVANCSVSASSITFLPFTLFLWLSFSVQCLKHPLSSLCAPISLFRFYLYEASAVPSLFVLRVTGRSISFADAFAAPKLVGQGRRLAFRFRPLAVVEVRKKYDDDDDGKTKMSTLDRREAGQAFAFSRTRPLLNSLLLPTVCGKCDGRFGVGGPRQHTVKGRTGHRSG